MEAYRTVSSFTLVVVDGCSTLLIGQIWQMTQFKKFPEEEEKGVGGREWRIRVLVKYQQQQQYEASGDGTYARPVVEG